MAPGWRAEVDLPYGVTAVDIIDQPGRWPRPAQPKVTKIQASDQPGR
jgi:hypothetical protein